MTVYILIKENQECTPPYRTIEGVFQNEKEAEDIKAKRIGLHDRDDKNCEFVIEPWFVGIPTVRK